MAEEDKAKKQRFSAETTLEELAEMTDPKGSGKSNVETPEEAQSEFDRLLKRYVHMDPKAMQMARKRFAKRILEGMNTPNSYTLHFQKDRSKPDGSRDVPERIRGASWADDTERDDEDEES